MSQAAKDLGLNLSTLSRRIQGLEDKLAEPLLQRTARGIVLTTKGEQLYSELPSKAYIRSMATFS